MRKIDSEKTFFALMPKKANGTRRHPGDTIVLAETNYILPHKIFFVKSTFGFYIQLKIGEKTVFKM